MFNVNVLLECKLLPHSQVFQDFPVFLSLMPCPGSLDEQHSESGCLKVSEVDLIGQTLIKSYKERT